MPPEPVHAPATRPDRMAQWRQSQAGQSGPLPDAKPQADCDLDQTEPVILRPTWPRVFPPL
jgi:hypothetical protein